MRPRDPAHRRQPEARTTLGRGKESVEDATKILRAYAPARVRHLDDCFFAVVFSLFLPDSDSDASFFFDRFDGVNNQIQNRIFDLRRVSKNDEIFRGSFKFHVDAATSTRS